MPSAVGRWATSLPDLEPMTIISGGVRVPMNRREVDSSKAASPGCWLLTRQVETTFRLLMSITWIWLAMETDTKSVVPDLSNKSSEGWATTLKRSEERRVGKE